MRLLLCTLFYTLCTSDIVYFYDFYAFENIIILFKNALYFFRHEEVNNYWIIVWRNTLEKNSDEYILGDKLLLLHFDEECI